jgi:para-aminobenzoate synthetase
MKTLLIDNYDSFTFNVFHLLAEVNGDEPIVVRNDAIEWPDVARLPIDNIVISPGPGTPARSEDFGICSVVLRESHLPVLGVCLGHQGLGAVYGATVDSAPHVMHGRLSRVYHDGSPLFHQVPQGFRAVRYHSLVVVHPLPACLEVSAWTDDGTIMGLRHRERPLWGVQFHPESVLTEAGRQLMINFRDLTQMGRAGDARPRRTYLVPPISAEAPLALTEPSHPDPAGPHQPRGDTLKVCYRRLATCYDPERVFTQLLGSEPYAFWLDSSLVTTGLSRFSFMGTGAPRENALALYDAPSRSLQLVRNGSTTRRCEGVLDYLQRELVAHTCEAPELPFDFVGGFVGYLGYEVRGGFGAHAPFRAHTPDAAFLFVDRFIAFDHVDGATYLVCLTRTDREAEARAWFDGVEWQLSALSDVVDQRHFKPPRLPDTVVFQLNRPYAEYIDNIRTCLQHLAAGETYEVCLTNGLTAASKVDPLLTYQHLRHGNPAPYAAFLRLDALAVLSSSPERFVRVDRCHVVEAKPIKGTAPRGATPEEDSLLREALRTSEKDRAENLMIVDLLRNDLGRVCQIGSVAVASLMEVETYQTVHQLVSTVRGQLRPDLDAIDCVRAAFPGGSMTGAPKLRTMQILESLERQARGIYSGVFGYLSVNGTADLSIIIRTIVTQDGTPSIGIGGAIVAQSDPECEYDEMLLKGRAPMEAIALAVTGRHDEDAWQIGNGRTASRGYSRAAKSGQQPRAQ